MFTFQLDGIEVGPSDVPDVGLVVARSGDEEIVVGAQRRLHVERLVVVTVEPGYRIMTEEKRESINQSIIFIFMRTSFCRDR